MRRISPTSAKREFDVRSHPNRFRVPAVLLLLGIFLAAELGAGAAPALAQTPPQQSRVAPRPRPAASELDAGLVKDTRTPAGQTTLGIVTAAPNLTDSIIGYELSTVLMAGQETGPNGEMALRIVPMVGRGGIQNVRDVLTLPGADMGIAPTIVLDRLRESKELGNIERKLVYIAPLYVQELHVLAGREIRTISDLAGKSVNVGEDEATEALARDIFETLRLKVTWVNIDHAAAIERIRSGEVGATILLSGKPVRLLAGQLQDGGLHLLPLANDLLLNKGYLPADLTAADYPHLIKADERIGTVAVGSVLFAYNWPVGSPRHRLLADFVRAFFSRISEFQTGSRHPKWQEVNLAASLPEWRRFAAAERWLKQARPAPAVAGPAEFDRYLSETGSIPSRASERERLYRDFLRRREQEGMSARAR